MAEIANVVYNSEWPCQPSQFRKLLVLIIARAQIPNVFMGLKIVDCSLESFTKVSFSDDDRTEYICGHIFFLLQLSKTAATCYIMFRNISAR